jgi:hypothetical protein
VLRVLCRKRPVAFPGRAPRALASRVPDLHARQGALAADKVVDAAVLRDVRVVVYAGAVVGLAAPFFHRGLLGEHDARAAHRELAEVNEVIVGRTAVFGRVLAHRRDDDAVARGHAAQRDRGEEQRQWGAGSHEAWFR